MKYRYLKARINRLETRAARDVVSDLLEVVYRTDLQDLGSARKALRQIRPGLELLGGLFGHLNLKVKIPAPDKGHGRAKLSKLAEDVLADLYLREEIVLSREEE